MTAAQELREAMEGQCPFTKDEFIEAVKDGILRNGRYTFTTNWRTEQSYHFGGPGCPEIPIKYLQVVMEWVRQEGFNTTTVHNPYGGSEYDVTL